MGGQYHGLRCPAAVRVTHFLGLGTVAKNDLLAILPQRLAMAFMSMAPWQILEPPVPPPLFDAAQHRHECFHHNSGKKWSRRRIAVFFWGTTRDGRRGRRHAPAHPAFI